MNICGSSGPYCDRVSRRNLLKVGTLGLAGLSTVDYLRLQAAGALLCEAPVEIRGPYGRIGTIVPGMDICESMPGFAKVANRFSIIRSCCHTNPGHGGGQRWVNTGHQPAALEDELPHDYPMLVAVVSKI